MANLKDVSDASFQTDVLSSDRPVLVDFWAAWCGPCRAMSPVLEEVAGAFDGKIKVLKMDVDANHQVPAQYSIRGIPTMILFKDGKMVDQLVGVQDRRVVEQLIGRAL